MSEDSPSANPPKSKLPLPVVLAATGAAFVLGGWVPAIGVMGAQYAAHQWTKK